MVSFNDLPVEIVEHILDELPLDDWKRHNRRTLDNISRTSKLLHALTTPRLYRAPLGEYKESQSTDDGENWPLLVRTLIARKDLRKLVKTLNFSGTEWESWDYAPQLFPVEVAALYHQYMKPDKHYPLESTDPAEYTVFTAESARWESSRDGCEWTDQRIVPCFDLDILLSFCSTSLESLTIELSRYDASTTFQLCPAPTSLPALRHIHFEYALVEGEFNPEAREIGGTIVTPLLRAAQKNCESVQFTGMVECRLEVDFDFCLERVKSAKIDYCLLTHHDFKTLFRLMPNLESFQCNLGDDYFREHYFNLEEIPPKTTAASARDAITRLCPKLRYLYLELDDGFTGEWKKEECDDVGEWFDSRGIV
ncbi:hypothetical protein QBC38DRAFT_518122 [Podospora fimiseda]|uniref:F-box domain-containing protein n=1 Tax=Podospora fimiseda TaxID=252190 RepID=A0AAN6YTK8_9PEZI|nr:hypothetical protein QBC38DRAFT_518122 [Podospora fimiseda]